MRGSSMQAVEYTRSHESGNAVHQQVVQDAAQAFWQNVKCTFSRLAKAARKSSEARASSLLSV